VGRPHYHQKGRRGIPTIVCIQSLAKQKKWNNKIPNGDRFHADTTKQLHPTPFEHVSRPVHLFHFHLDKLHFSKGDVLRGQVQCTYFFSTSRRVMGGDTVRKRSFD